MKKNGDIIPFIKQKDYIMVNDDLGSSSFGKTVLLQDPFIDELFVAKKYEPEFEEDKERFYKNFLDEIKILYKLNHRNIVRIYNYYAYGDIYTGYILMEYIEGENIGKFIKEYIDIFENVTLDDVFLQLIDGFCYIEERGIIHRDIREGNILVDKTGTVKIIDFGIGKVLEKLVDCKDSLVTEINRAGSDTLPQEYYEGIYTTKTDMFYLAELFNRLLIGANEPSMLNFSYQDILNKMMAKQPENRYVSFANIREAIDKRDFINMEISQADKKMYRDFIDPLYESLSSFTDERKFNYDKNIFVSKIEKALRENFFEECIQNNSDIISSIISGAYSYKNRVVIHCSVVKKFLEWFKKANTQSQELIVKNIISKLSLKEVIEKEMELPF